MPEGKDFKTNLVQAYLYTPELQFRAAKVLGYFLTEYGAQFDGDPMTVGAPPNFPRELPQLLVKSADGKLRLQAGPVRLDVIKEQDDMTEAVVVDFLRWATDLGLNYLRTTQGKAGRIACVLNRATHDSNPSKTLTKHFCQQRWIDGPLNRPEEFELHAHKRFRLDDLFEINSWFRCKTGITLQIGEAAPVRNLIVVEQDFNSLGEQMETREIRNEEIRRFFELAPQELRRVLDLYFPANG